MIRVLVVGDTMLRTHGIIIPIPKPRHHKPLLMVGSTDVTAYVEDSKFDKPVTNGIGKFFIKLKNSNGRFSDLFNPGDTVLWYCDNSDGTRRRFYGRVDYAKEVMKKEGQFLEIDGRHRSYLLGEVRVCYSATDTDTADILREIAGKYAPGFTVNNVATSSGTTMSVEWHYKPFWACVKRLCQRAEYDCRVDDDLDIHYFEENSVINEDEAIVEGQNYIECPEFGVDNFYEKSKVIVMGQDSNGFPLMYTHPPNYTGDAREVFIKDTSADTLAKCQAIAKAEYNDKTGRPPQAKIKSHFMETLEAGENVLIMLMRQKINAYYKVIQVSDLFGSRHGGIRNECLIEKEIIGNEQIMIDRIETENDIQEAPNVHKMDQGYNLTFDDSSDVESLTDVEIVGKQLKLESGKTEGTFISKARVASKNVTEGYLLFKGQDLDVSTIYITVDNGLSYQTFTEKTLTDITTPDINIKIKVVLKSNTANPDPRLDGVVFLYS